MISCLTYILNIKALTRPQYKSLTAVVKDIDSLALGWESAQPTRGMFLSTVAASQRGAHNEQMHACQMLNVA